MNTSILTIAAMIIAGSTAMAVAQGTPKAMTGATPSGPSHQSGSQLPATSPSGTSRSAPAVTTIAPGPTYSTTNMGNTSESNGILGSHGARGDQAVKGRVTGSH